MALCCFTPLELQYSLLKWILVGKWKLPSISAHRCAWEFFHCFRLWRKTRNIPFCCESNFFLNLEQIFNYFYKCKRIFGTIFWILKSLDYTFLKRYDKLSIIQSTVMFSGGLFFMYLVIAFSNDNGINIYQQAVSWILSKFSINSYNFIN